RGAGRGRALCAASQSRSGGRDRRRAEIEAGTLAEAGGGQECLFGRASTGECRYGSTRDRNQTRQAASAGRGVGDSRTYVPGYLSGGRLGSSRPVRWLLLPENRPSSGEGFEGNHSRSLQGFGPGGMGVSHEQDDAPGSAA